MANLCRFDSTLTTFDSSVRRFDQTTCSAIPAGRRRRHPFVQIKSNLELDEKTFLADDEEVMHIAMKFLERIQ